MHVLQQKSEVSPSQIKERVYGRRFRMKEFSLYVSNIPFMLDHYGLKGIFQKIGTVSDAYIPPRRQRLEKPRFDFVRFWCKEEALRSITQLNNAIIRGRRIQVSMVKYGKCKYQSKIRSQLQRGKWRWEET